MIVADKHYKNEEFASVIGKTYFRTNGLALNQIEDIVNRYTSGESVNGLSVDYQINQQTVRYYLIKAGVYVKWRNPPVRNIVVTRREIKPRLKVLLVNLNDTTDIRDRYNAGSSYEQLLKKAYYREPKNYEPYLQKQTRERYEKERHTPICD